MPLSSRFNDEQQPQSPLPIRGNRPLNYQSRYPCPICHHGQLQEIVLTDAFSCTFCRHIFTADLKAQCIRVEDIPQPLSWRWLGRDWVLARPSQVEMTLSVWLAAIAVVILPPSIIWLSAHTLLPLSDRGTGFSSFWASLTFLLHLGMVGWVIAEHYQLPLYLSAKLNLQRLWSRQWFGREG